MKQLFSLGSDWVITPAGGATGEAYVAKSDNQKLFLKRNSTPFIAVLSAEGIVPKLVWTKRMESGDVVTAQQWLEGRKLDSRDIDHPTVAKLLSKIHHSAELLDMLKRIHDQPIYPESILEDIEIRVLPKLTNSPHASKAFRILQDDIPIVHYSNLVVCHGDVNHNNWLLGDAEQQLYLIDWDGAMIADPAMDLGLLLYCYVPRKRWDSWLTHYGAELTPSLQHRMRWYVIAQTLMAMAWNINRCNDEQFQKCSQQLWEIIETDYFN